jgi:hypothetical protein
MIKYFNVFQNRDFNEFQQSYLTGFQHCSAIISTHYNFNRRVSTWFQRRCRRRAPDVHGSGPRGPTRAAWRALATLSPHIFTGQGGISSFDGLDLGP